MGHSDKSSHAEDGEGEHSEEGGEEQIEAAEPAASASPGDESSSSTDSHGESTPGTERSDSKEGSTSGSNPSPQRRALNTSILAVIVLFVLASAGLALFFFVALGPQAGSWIAASSTFIAIIAVFVSIWSAARSISETHTPFSSPVIRIFGGLGLPVLLVLDVLMVRYLTEGRDARIINTSGIGVAYFLQPNLTGGKLVGPREGETVRVVCQVRDGQPITDTNQPTPYQPPMWPVWNRARNGYYFPDIWTDLPKDPLRPVEGIPVCSRD